MPLVTLKDIRKKLPDNWKSSPYALMISWSAKNGLQDEYTIIGDEVWKAPITNDLDPDGYRLGLVRVLSIYSFFYEFHKDSINKTPMEIIEEIYGKYDDIYWWFNQDNPIAKTVGTKLMGNGNFGSIYSRKV